MILSLCEDVIHEILSYCNTVTITSFYLCTKDLIHNKSLTNKAMINRRILIDELKKTQEKTRKYYKCRILKLQINDRVTDFHENYRVIKLLGKKQALLEYVDMYGHHKNEYIYTTIYTLKSRHGSLSFWHIAREIDHSIYIYKLSYGIIKNQQGPRIIHANSHYLDYITISSVYPCYHMLVLVCYKTQFYEYVITDCHDDKITMNIINPNHDIKNIIIATKMDNQWKIKNHKYKIIQFGGFLSHVNSKHV